MSSILRRVKGVEQPTYYCDKCGKKISRKGELIKTARHITSNSIPELDGKDLCKVCCDQL